MARELLRLPGASSGAGIVVTGLGESKALSHQNKVLVLSEPVSIERRELFLLDRLTPHERDLVTRRCIPKLAKKNATIFRQGDAQRGIYLVLSGGVRVFYVAPSGREITRAYWFAGNFIGGPDVFAQSPNMWTAVAIRDTSLLLLPSVSLRTLCERIPNLAIGLIEAMVFKGRCYSAMAQMLGTRSAGERLNRVLLLLSEMYGSATEQGVAINVPITHEEIAHMVGVSRQWVTVGMKRLQADGHIEFGRGKILIRNLDMLSAAPQSDVAQAG
jgi:CRP/FNR family cyclic AMP-dependent transcriptional regulator